MISGYIIRLMNCGMSYDKACNIYSDIIRNFGIVELEVYVRHMEITCYVGKV